MALRALQGPTGGGSPVGGTGTTGTIPVWTGPSTLGNSLLSQSGAIVTNSGTFRADNGAVTEPAYTFSASSGTGMYRATSNALLRFAVSGAYAFGVDTNGNVGMGTASPATTLHVARNGTTDPAIIGSGTNSAVGNFESSDFGRANRWTFGRDNSLTGNFVLAYNGSPLMNTTSSGNVGIGTASPAARAHILGTSAASTLIVANSTTSSWMEFRGSTSSTIGYVGTAPGLVVGGAATDMVMRVEGANNLLFVTNATERARIDSNGNLVVGLGASASTSTNRLQLANNSTAKQGIEFRPGVAIGGGTGNEIINYDRNLGVYLGTEWSSSFFRLSLSGSYFEASTSGAGLKLNATPGNTDPNTLDAYRDGGTAGSGGVSFTATLKGLVSDPTTPVTTTGKYILVGKLLVMTIVFSDVNTTGAAGAIYVQTNLAAALRPERNCVGAVTLDSIATITGVGTHVIADTAGDIYVAQNTSNAAVSFCTHNAGAARGLTLTVSYMIP